MFAAGPHATLAAAVLLAFGPPRARPAQPGSHSGGSWHSEGGSFGSQSGDWSWSTKSFCGGSRYDLVSLRSPVYGYSEFTARGWWLGNADPTVCYSNSTRAAFGLDSTNDSSALLGYFVCPLPKDADSLYCCCGKDEEQFCCSILDYTIMFYRTELFALAAAATILLLWGLSSFTKRNLRKPESSASHAESSSGGAVQRSDELQARSTCSIDRNFASINCRGTFQYDQLLNLSLPPYEVPAPPPTYEDAVKNPNLPVNCPA